MIAKKIKYGLLGLMSLVSISKAQEVKTLKVDLVNAKADVPEHLWGVFFEDINMGADGGIYAELVKNRSFEFAQPLMGWKVVGKGVKEGDALVLNRGGKEHERNPRYISLSTAHAEGNSIGLENEGFRGMGVKKGLRYDFSLLYRTLDNGLRLTLELLDNTGTVIGTAELPLTQTSGEWKKFNASFNSSATDSKGRFRLLVSGKGKVDMDMISLFPEDTWMRRPGGLRADMVQLLADLKPGFVRFPGGCIVEGRDLANRFQWKKTVGPVENRQLIINRWNTEFRHKLTPDYFQSFGLGFYEYFLLAEDIGAEPLPILNCGMACQFNTGELVPLEDLGEYVQDALDLIEFANGDISTDWGKLRADMGHPEPFHLKMLGVGNENWGPQYIERLAIFQKAIKTTYPDIQIIASSGTDPDGERFEFLDKQLRAMKIDVIDEHFYRNPEWFLKNAARYDHYDRGGSKIFAGEYAAHTDRVASNDNRNTWRAAVAEAAFLTGIERNADVVVMASYAPLFAHVDGWQWSPDLIWIDNLRAYGTPSYYVQQLYSTNRGDKIVPLTKDGMPLEGRDSLYASAMWDSKTKELIVKVVNHSHQEQHIKLDLGKGTKWQKSALGQILHASDMEDVNTLDAPRNVSPLEKDVATATLQKDLAMQPYSFHVYRIKSR